LKVCPMSRLNETAGHSYIFFGKFFLCGDSGRAGSLLTPELQPFCSEGLVDKLWLYIPA